MESDSRQAKSALIAIGLVAFALRIVVALTLPNILHADEVFQYLEQAHRLLYGYGIIPWEFREGARSWFFPGLLAGAMRLGSLVFPGPFGYLQGVRVALGMLSLAPVIAGFLWANRVGGIKSAVVTGFLCAVWFELVYFAAKTLTEPVSSCFLIFGLLLSYPNPTERPRLRLFLSGVALGLAVSLRVQLAPAALVILLYVCRNAWREKWAPMLAGLFVPLSALGLVDWVTWNDPFLWKFHYVNFFQNVAVRRIGGPQPWSYYWDAYKWDWSIAIIPLFGFAVVGARRLPLLCFVALAIILPHMFVAHKEFRYVFAATPLIIILAGLGSVEVVSLVRGRSHPLAWRPIVLLMAAWLSTSLALAISNHFRAYWTRKRNLILAARYLNARSDLWGVGLYQIRWSEEGGYAFLHRNVPLYGANNPQDLERLKASFNYLVAPANFPSPHPSFELQACWPGDEGTCVYKRPGGCGKENLRERILEGDPDIRFHLR